MRNKEFGTTCSILRRGGPFLCPPGDQQAPNDRIKRALRAQLVLETARCPDRSTLSVASRADTRKVRPYESGGRALIAKPVTGVDRYCPHHSHAVTLVCPVIRRNATGAHAVRAGADM